ncbi:hypothetical protein HK105_207150 [Polyrhizophydium stewartii]|uniref:NDT80 domain-containing protein n=1 Tax=Polyrhizophydium stewartii TaxID=2732419 RepID=A0ABR4N1N2_9FUNG
MQQQQQQTFATFENGYNPVTTMTALRDVIDGTDPRPAAHHVLLLAPSTQELAKWLTAIYAAFSIDTDYQQARLPKYITSMAARLDRGFFLSNSQRDWTCYRRNYFQLSASFSCTAPDGSQVRLPCMAVAAGVVSRIESFEIRISARVANAIKEIPLIQQTAKRQQSTQSDPKPVPCVPGGDVDHYDLSHPSTIATFERIQFKSATANNGKRHNTQQYFAVIASLWGVVEGAAAIKLASIESAPLVVRGRSPAHYNDSVAPASAYASAGARGFAPPRTAPPGSQIPAHGPAALAATGFGPQFPPGSLLGVPDHDHDRHSVSSDHSGEHSGEHSGDGGHASEPFSAVTAPPSAGLLPSGSYPAIYSAGPAGALPFSHSTSSLVSASSTANNPVIGTPMMAIAEASPLAAHTAASVLSPQFALARRNSFLSSAHTDQTGSPMTPFGAAPFPATSGHLVHMPSMSSMSAISVPPAAAAAAAALMSPSVDPASGSVFSFQHVTAAPGVPAVPGFVSSQHQQYQPQYQPHQYQHQQPQQQPQPQPQQQYQQQYHHQQQQYPQQYPQHYQQTGLPLPNTPNTPSAEVTRILASMSFSSATPPSHLQQPHATAAPGSAQSFSSIVDDTTTTVGSTSSPATASAMSASSHAVYQTLTPMAQHQYSPYAIKEPFMARRSSLSVQISAQQLFADAHNADTPTHNSGAE